MPSEIPSDQLYGVLEIVRRANVETDPRALATLITEQACALLQAERGALFQLEKESGELYSIVATGLPGKTIRVKLHQGIAGLVAATGQPINLPDAYADERFFRGVDEASGYHTRQLVCVPIKNRRGDVLGVLQLLNKAGGSFTASDQEILSVLASLVGNAWTHAQVYEALRTSLTRLSRLMRVGAAIGSELDLDPLLRIISQTTSHVLQAERSTVFLSAEDGKPAVSVAVEDTGIGISPELHEKIFERFFQVDTSPTRQFGGVGIGLAVVKQIIGAHGSRVRVKSEPDRGSVFVFTLPVSS